MTGMRERRKLYFLSLAPVLFPGEFDILVQVPHPDSGSVLLLANTSAGAIQPNWL